MKNGVYDIEVLKNCFICCVLIDQVHYVFEISERKNDLSEMVQLFKERIMFLGYNNHHYDDVIMNYIIINQNYLDRLEISEVLEIIKTLSDSIINDVDMYKWKPYKNRNIFSSIDLMTMMFSQDLRVGLKPLQVSMCYKNVQEMQVDWSAPIHLDDIDSLIYYCKNDVDSTSYLSRVLKNDLSLRVSIRKDFGINCLSKDGVGVGVDIFTKYICEDLPNANNKYDLLKYRDNLSIIHVKDYIAPCISFKTKALQEILDWYKSLVLDSFGKINGKSPSREVLVNKMRHACGIGGLHSVNRPIVHNPEPGYIYRDKDVRRNSVVTL